MKHKNITTILDTGNIVQNILILIYIFVLFLATANILKTFLTFNLKNESGNGIDDNNVMI